MDSRFETPKEYDDIKLRSISYEEDAEVKYLGKFRSTPLLTVNDIDSLAIKEGSQKGKKGIRG